MKNKNYSTSRTITSPLDSQAGVTLLMSILIMASIFIVTVTISAFAIQELRSARSSSLSEPAIIGAETGGEQGIWLIKRGNFSDTCPAANPTLVDGVTDSTTNPSRVVISKCVSYGLATFEMAPLEQLTFFLYDPNDINGNLCMNEVYDPETYAGCGGNALYTGLMVNNRISNFAINVNILTLDNVSFPGGTNVNVAPKTTQWINIPDPIGGGSSDERLRVVITNTDLVNPATIDVNTSGIVGGMPDFPTVDAEGCSSITVVASCYESAETFKRRINITVPR